MTTQEILKNVNYCLETGFTMYLSTKEDVQTVKNALEKQIPKEPDLIGDGYDDNGNLIYDTWICPCCQTEYELDYDDYKFCPECGQAIDRSVKE